MDGAPGRVRELEAEVERLRAALERIAKDPYPDADPGDDVSHRPLELCHDEMLRIADQALSQQEVR